MYVSCIYIYIYRYIHVYIYIYILYTRSPSQDSPSQDFRQGLGCSGTHLFIGGG